MSQVTQEIAVEELPHYEIAIVNAPEVSFVNFNGLREWTDNLLSKYHDLVISEDQVKDIKKEMAALNKVKAEIKDYSKGVIAKLREPIEAIEDEVSQITTEIDATYSALKEQIDSFEEKAREEKKQVVLEVFESICTTFAVEPWSIEIKKTWTNKSTSFKKINEELTAIVRQRVAELMEQRNAQAVAQQPTYQAQVPPTSVTQAPSLQPLLMKPSQHEPSHEEQKRAPEQTGALAANPLQPQQNLYTQNLQNLSTPLSELTTMNIVVTWNEEVDDDVRSLLRQVKAKALRFALRRISNPKDLVPTTAPLPQQTQQQPAATNVTSQKTTFCYMCKRYKADTTDAEKGVCQKNGEVVERFTPGCDLCEQS